MWVVYIIRSCNKRWHYVGSTNRLEKRLSEHNEGLVMSTKHYRPFKLIFEKKFYKEYEARNYERKLKKCRIEKEKIIRQFENFINK
jgi:putative endonuclease